MKVYIDSLKAARKGENCGHDLKHTPKPGNATVVNSLPGSRSTGFHCDNDICVQDDSKQKVFHGNNTCSQFFLCCLLLSALHSALHS